MRKDLRLIPLTAAVIVLSVGFGRGMIRSNAETVIFGGGTTAAYAGTEAAAETPAAVTETAAQLSEAAVIGAGPAPVTAAPVTASLSVQETLAAVTETTAAAAASGLTRNGYANGAAIGLDPSWQYADHSVIHTGQAVMYTASSNRKNRIVSVNAGHGTSGGESVKTLCHPDGSAKLTGGSTAAGATKATAVSSGMTFKDGTPERSVTLQMAQILKTKLLAAGYDVLMIREGADVQLDNIARTVISNNAADIHIALHWDGDGLSYDKGVYYMSVPDGLKSMEPVKSHWQSHEALGDALIGGLRAQGIKVWGSNPLDTDLTQTSYSTIPSVDIELGNQCSDHSEARLNAEADGIVQGVNAYFGF